MQAVAKGLAIMIFSAVLLLAVQAQAESDPEPLGLTCHNNTKATWAVSGALLHEEEYKVSPNNSIIKIVAIGTVHVYDGWLKLRYVSGDCSDCPQSRECVLKMPGDVGVKNMDCAINSKKYTAKPWISLRVFSDKIVEKTCY